MIYVGLFSSTTHTFYCIVESEVSAPIDDLTLILLGQTDPPAASTAFAGELSQFAIWDRSLPLKEIRQLANCGHQAGALTSQVIEQVQERKYAVKLYREL